MARRRRIRERIHQPVADYPGVGITRIISGRSLQEDVLENPNVTFASRKGFANETDQILWFDLAHEVFDLPGRSYTDRQKNRFAAAIVINSVQTQAAPIGLYDVTVYLADEATTFTAQDPAGDSEDSFIRIKEAAEVTIKDELYPQRRMAQEDIESDPDRRPGHDHLAGWPTPGQRPAASMDFLLEILDDYLLLPNNSASVAVIDGVFVEWRSAVYASKQFGQFIVMGSARTAFADVWANAVEEVGRTRELIGDGTDIMDAAPPTNEDAIAWSQEMWARLAEKNRKQGVYSAGSAWVIAVQNAFQQGSHNRAIENEENFDMRQDFAHDTAMQAMGHGVSWADNYPDHKLKVPQFEANFIVDVPEVRRITITREDVYPDENDGDPDYEQGWENEEGDVIAGEYDDPDEVRILPSGETAAYVDNAVAYLRDAGVVEYSSSHPDFTERYAPGTTRRLPPNNAGSYIGQADTDFRTGTETTFQYHLEGFTDEEQGAIYNLMFTQRQIQRFLSIKEQPTKRLIEEFSAVYRASPTHGHDVNTRSMLTRLVEHLHYEVAYSDEKRANVLRPAEEFFSELLEYLNFTVPL